MALGTKAEKKRNIENNSEREQPQAQGARRVSEKASLQKGGRRKQLEANAPIKSDANDSLSDAYENEAVEGEDDDDDDDDDDVVVLDSDELDDSDFEAAAKGGRKRKRVSAASKTSPQKKIRTSMSSQKKQKSSLIRKKKKNVSSDDEEEVELADGQEIVGTVVEAPKTGRVPPGQISRNTLNFLKQLQDPKYNDRIWFKLNEPVFRQAEKEWKDFIDEITPLLQEADPQIPILPPNDVTHRIYRDVRFSNDKTPYKTNFSASFSRSGRKGIFAGYHVSIKPGGSLLAAGTWCPGKNELQTIRNNIMRSSRRIRQLISAPAFVELFGEAKPHPKGQHRNIFGMDDELKVAPKGIDKTHKDIDLLKCRSFAVVHKFSDAQVLDPGFKEELTRVVAIVQPFVHGLNDMMTIAPAGDASGSESEAEAEAEAGAGGED